MNDKPDMPVTEFVDNRSRSELIGEYRIRQGRPKGPQEPITHRAIHPTLTVADKDARIRARKLALDYAEQAILTCADIMQSGNNRDRLEAAKLLMQYGLGKPATLQIDTGGGPLIPNLTIVLGDEQVTFESISKYLIDEPNE